MAKKTSSAFDALLETFGNDEDKTLFTQLAEKNPKVMEFGLRQDDYSRKLDEHRTELEELQGWRDWRTANWDPEAKMTKAEREKQTRLETLETEKADLESRIALGGDMSFEDVERFGNEWLKKTGIDPTKLVKTDAFDEKVKGFEQWTRNLNAYTAKAALEVPYLNSKHQQEFGEMFDPEEFLKAANEAGTVDLRGFYNDKYVASKRIDKMKADYDAKLKEKDDALVAEKKAADERLARVAGMGPQGSGSPTDMEGPTMGPLQKKLLGMEKRDDSSGAPEVPLGDLGIAAYAAREFNKNAAGR